MEAPFVLVVNPRAGSGSAAKKQPKLERALRRAGAHFVSRATERRGHATELVREALRDGAPGVAIVGGDGTFNEAVNGYFDEAGEPVAPEAWIAPLPCGTGGDFRRTVGVSNRTEAMATQLMWATPRPIDVGWLTFVADDGQETRRAFVNIASFGLGGLVDRAVERTPAWLSGRAAYLVATTQSMIGYENPEVRLTLDDGEPRVARVLNVAVANGRYFGGGMKVAPEAEVDDGRFDVVALEMSAASSLRLTAHIYSGKHLSHPDAWCERATKVYAEPVEPDAQILLDVDGEAPGRLPATFEIAPGAMLLRA